METKGCLFLIAGVVLIIIIGIFIIKWTTPKPIKSLGIEPEIGGIYYIGMSTIIETHSVMGNGEIISYPSIIVNRIFTDSLGVKFVEFKFYNRDKPSFEQDSSLQNMKYDQFIKCCYLKQRGTVII